MTEIWRPCHRGAYSVSDQGRVRRELAGKGVRRNRILKPFLRAGYPAVDLFDGFGNRRAFHVHTLVAAAFSGPRPAGTQVNHISGVKGDGRASNLEYVTVSENAKHAHRMGLSKLPDNHGRRFPTIQGERHRDAKLTEEAVREIRIRRAAGAGGSALAREFGVSPGTVSAIVTRRTWRHVA